jgi:uncharacterized protein with gpF-like domain
MSKRPPFLSHSREREREIHLRMMDKLWRRHRRSVADEITRETVLMVNAYRDLGFVPAVPDDHMQRMRTIYAKMTYDSVQTFGRRMFVSAKALGLDLETKETFGEMFARLALNWIAQEAIRRRISSVAETTRRMIVDAVAQGQAEGLGVEAIAKLIEDQIPGIARRRGAVIARTETHGAANYGAQEAARATGLELRKEWLSVHDHRTRDFGEGDGVADKYNHRSMDGQKVGMDEPFKMPVLGGMDILCQRPGDPSLPAGASINCRCTVGYIPAGFD